MRFTNLILSASLAVTLPIAALADTAASKAVVTEALNQMFVERNADAIDQFYASDLIQHNLRIPSGSAPLKGMIAKVAGNSAFKAAFPRVIADGDIVVTHGRFEGLGPTPMISFDVFRVTDGKIVEHWDNLIPEQPLNPSGHSQIDGATEITDLDQSDANKAKVEDFLTRALINHEKLDFTQFINPANYVQHNPLVADGLEGFGAFMKEMATKGITMDYTKIHRVIGEGNFVLTMSEGAIGGQPQAFYDLFRLENGLIVEHWDVIAPMPAADAPHNDAGKF